jgi:hypothetical protein
MNLHYNRSTQVYTLLRGGDDVRLHQWLGFMEVAKDMRLEERGWRALTNSSACSAAAPAAVALPLPLPLPAAILAKVLMQLAFLQHKAHQQLEARSGVQA